MVDDKKNRKRNIPVAQELLSLANLPKKKKINFFFGVLVVIGSSIGAGIFFKSEAVLTNNSQSLILAIISWVVASIAIVLMAISLFEISAKNKGNLSFVGWNQKFNSWMTFQISKSFNLYINVALTYFFMPLYAILSFQDGAKQFGFESFGTKADWAIWMVIVIVIGVYFLVTSGLNVRLASWQNAITLVLKIIALLAVTIVGITFFAKDSSVESTIHWLPVNKPQLPNTPSTFQSIIPFGGLFISWAAIFFAYDGFYVSTGIEEEMKEPKKTPLALFLGLSIVTIIHLIVAIAMSLNGRGDFKEYSNFLNKEGVGWIFGVINFCISLGVIGIINGFSLWMPRFVEELLDMGELPFHKKLKNKLNLNYPKVGVIYSIVLIVPIVVLFCVLGSLVYFPKNDVLFSNYGTGMSSLYNFADLMSNWVSLIAFALIGASFFGAIVHHRKQKAHFKKWFVYVTSIITFFLIIVVLVNFTIPIVDLFMIISERAKLTQDVYDVALRGRALQVIVLLLFLFVMVIPPLSRKIYMRVKLNKYISKS